MEKQIDSQEGNEMNRKAGTLIKGKSRTVLFMHAWVTALAITVSLETPDPKHEGIDILIYEYLYKILSQFGEWVTDQGFLMTILTAGLFLLYRLVWKEEKERIRFSRGMALALAVLFAGAKAFSCADSLSAWYSPLFNLFKTGILICGFYFFYSALIQLLYDVLHCHRDVTWKDGKLLHIYRRHPWLMPWCLIFLMWVPHLIMRYPGAMSYDNYAELVYLWGYKTFTTAQPVFHTWLFGSFIRFGAWAGSANAGLFLFVLFQSLIMSAVLAGSLFLMKKWKSPVWLRLLAVGIYCIAPYYAGYAAFPIKDYLYTAFFVLFVLEVMELFRKDGLETFKKRSGYNVLWVAAVCLMILFRKNGLYVYLPVMICMLAYDMILAVRKKRRLIWQMWIVLCLPVILSSCVERMIITEYQVVQDSPKEMFSLPFQQTARYVRDYGDEVTEEEREAIAAVLDYDLLPEAYEELTADPVKTTYHAQDMGALLKYFSVWFRQFLKHPVCYLEATWNQNYYLFAPNIDNIVYNKDCYAGETIVTGTGFEEEIRFEVPEGMRGLASIAVSWYTLLTRLPVIGMLNNVAFYVILMFCLLLFMLNDRSGKRMFVMVPLIMSFVFVILSPQIQNQPRYAFPIIYAMPSVVGFYLWMVRGKQKNGEPTEPDAEEKQDGRRIG